MSNLSKEADEKLKEMRYILRRFEDVMFANKSSIVFILEQAADTVDITADEPEDPCSQILLLHLVVLIKNALEMTDSFLYSTPRSKRTSCQLRSTTDHRYEAAKQALSRVEDVLLSRRKVGRTQAQALRDAARLIQNASRE